jgi:hypothetical protein
MQHCDVRPKEDTECVGMQDQVMTKPQFTHISQQTAVCGSAVLQLWSLKFVLNKVLFITTRN